MADLGTLLGGLGGGAIGQAIVRLELDTKKYTAEMEAAHAQTATSTNAMSSGFSKFSGLASTALLGVGAAAVAGAALSVKAAIEANEAHLKLQNTFENNKNLADSSVAAFERQAESIQGLTGVSDEAIMSAQALLGQFHDLTGEQVQQLIPAIVDLSAKMDIDLVAAAKAVGKATQGNTAGLQRYGIVIDEVEGKGSEFASTLDGLSVAAGFAADRAKQEPWRLLGAQFDEIAEDLGNILLPFLRDLAELLQGLVPILEGVAKGIELAFSAETYTDIPIIGDRFKELGYAIEDVGLLTQTSNDQVRRYGLPMLDEMKQVAGLAEAGFISLSETFPEIQNGLAETGRHVHRFAHMTQKDLEEWSDNIKDAFDKAVLGLEDLSTESGITSRDFIRAHTTMLREARDMAQALREISREKWINDEYVKFLSEQGPEWLIGFADATERQQRRAQEIWEKSTEKTDNAKASLDRITDVLKNIDNGTSKHDVIIEYHYVGFDPSKPGMSGSAQQR